MANGEAIKGGLEEFPIGQKTIHQGHKTLIVSGFEQVSHFVNDDVLQALARLLGEFSVEADSARLAGAAAPFRFHPLNEEPIDFDMHERLPFRDKDGGSCLELSPVPSFQNGLSLLLAAPDTDVEDNVAVLELDIGRSLPLNHF